MDSLFDRLKVAADSIIEQGLMTREEADEFLLVGQRKIWATHATRHGFRADHFGAVIRLDVGLFRIVGWSPRARSYRVKLRAVMAPPKYSPGDTIRARDSYVYAVLSEQESRPHNPETP